MLNFENLVQLAKTVAHANPSAPTSYAFGEEKFSYTDLDNTLRAELNELAGSYALWRENKNTVFKLLEETIDDVLPVKVNEQWGQFAEIKTIGQGDKAVFTQRITAASKRRAKKFVTRVGLAGMYEVARLDGKSLTVETDAFGGAAQIGFEEFLDGRVQFADVLNIMLEGLDEAIYVEIEKALKASTKQLPAANKYVVNGFNESSFDSLLTVVDSYGQKGVIYCTYEFAAKMLPLAGYPAWSDNMKEKYWSDGYFPVYKGHQVIVLPQSFVDETNSEKVIDPRYCWVFPSGASKPVKIAFEGGTQMRELENYDWSREVQCYKKLGIATIFTSNIGLFIDNSLSYNGAAAIDPRNI